MIIDHPGGTALTDNIENILHKACANKPYEILFFTFNGHGTSNGVCGNDAAITSYDDIQAKLDCFYMRGKPKIVIFDCYQGESMQEFFPQGRVKDISPKQS